MDSLQCSDSHRCSIKPAITEPRPQTTWRRPLPSMFNNEHFKPLISELALCATTQFLQMFTEQRRCTTPLVGEDVQARSYKARPSRKNWRRRNNCLSRPWAGKALGQAAIAFCIAHPAVSVTIPGARNEATNARECCRRRHYTSGGRPREGCGFMAARFWSLAGR
jgi:hypothetical protein